MRLDLRRILNPGALIRAPDRIQQHLIKRDQRLDIQLIATVGVPLNIPATQHDIAADLDALAASDLGKCADGGGAGELGAVDTMRALETGDERRVRRAQEGLAEKQVQRAARVAVAQLGLDVRHVRRRVAGAAAGPLERVQRRLHRERRPRRDSRQALDADGAAVARYGGQAACGRGVVHLLPLPEDVVDEAVVEEEHRAEAGRLAVAYVAVRAEDGVRVLYARLVEASNREVDGVVWAFE